MKYVEKYGVYIDDDLVIYAMCTSNHCGKKGQLRQLKPYLEWTGYPCVCVVVSGKPRHYPVHRIVAEAFIPNPDGLPTVDHINRIRTDYRICNLRRASHKTQADNTRSVDRGLAHYGVRCCEDRKEYQRRYDKEYRLLGRRG